MAETKKVKAAGKPKTVTEKKVTKPTARKSAGAGKTVAAQTAPAEPMPDKVVAVPEAKQPAVAAPASVLAAPATPAATKPIALVVLGIVAVLVVFEMTALLKGKVDRQRQLTQVGTLGVRGGEQRPEAFHGVIAMKIDALGRLLVVDSDWNKVVVYDSKTGAFVTSINKDQAKRDTFTPADVDADAQGNIYILDRPNMQILVFSSAGDLIRQFSAPNATALCVDKSGDVIVSDNQRMQVVRYNSEGKELKRLAAPGNGKGQLNNPYRLDADDQGNIYVLDAGNRRVEKFSAQGGFEKSWPLKFNPTIILGITAWGKEVYINDFEHGVIWIYSQNGHLTGQVNFPFPSNLAIDNTGNFYLPSPDGVARFIQVKGAPKSK